MNLTIEENGDVLCLNLDHGQVRFHAVWLRDNAQDTNTRDKNNNQRLVSLSDIAVDIAIHSACFVDTETLSIHFVPENISIDYQVAWLLAHRYDRIGGHEHGWVSNNLTLWNATHGMTMPEATFDAVRQDADACLNWLGGLAEYGFGKLTQGPVYDGALFDVVDLFGYVRETNYGRHFEVRVEEKPINLAFTGAGIQAHADNPYRDPVPTLQVLYCLENSAAGGDNMVVDGFATAQRLRDETPQYFEVLSRYCARFEFSGEAGVCLQSRKPMIELAPDGELICVRFNNRSAAPIVDVPFADMKTYYAAYRRFGEILNDSAMAVAFRLAPGECFVVDNTRVMHARKAFSGEGTRWLQGCYADKDGLLSKVRAAERRAAIGSTAGEKSDGGEV